MVPEKRKLAVTGAAIAAAFALPGCAPTGYQAADYGGVQPAADAAAEPDPAAGDTAAADKKTSALTAEKTTDTLTGTRVPRMGAVIEDEGGWVLYRFDKDTAKPTSTSACVGQCAKIWPPALTNDGKPKLADVDPKLVGTVTRADGTKQLTVAGWPLYRYIGDKKPGTWRGQNVNGTWFVIKPTGAKNLTCLPAVSKPVTPPADDSAGKQANTAPATGGGPDYSY